MPFVDEARIYIKAGDGGKGCESFYRDKYMRFPHPDGGDGGRGGDIIIQASRSIQTLLDFKYKQHYKAERGGHASSKNKTGKEGKPCILKVPLGTIIRDADEKLLIKDLVEDGQEIIVAIGGVGGLGNQSKKGPTLPEEGEERNIHLELKVIADVGLIGFPNAGKSTLISAISKVKSPIASYPFTTKQPVLGFVPEGDDGRSGFVVADLPGIIEGAHKGRGLGDRFLKHAERTKVLVHVIDMAGTEGRDPIDDFEKVEHELQSYSDQLMIKHKFIVANKMDCPDALNHLKRFKDKYKHDIISISALEKKGLNELLTVLRKVLC